MGKKVPKKVMINNWIDEKEIYPLSEDHPRVIEFKKKYGLDGKLVIMYSSKIGLYYDLRKLIKVIKQFRKGCTFQVCVRKDQRPKRGEKKFLHSWEMIRYLTNWSIQQKQSF